MGRSGIFRFEVTFPRSSRWLSHYIPGGEKGEKLGEVGKKQQRDKGPTGQRIDTGH